MIIEIVIAILLGIFSPSLTAFQNYKRKTKKDALTKTGGILLIIMVGFVIYCFWSLGIKNGLIILLIIMLKHLF